MEHKELIEGAFVNYLAALDVWTESLNVRIFAGQNNLDKDGARIVCYVDDVGQEDPPTSGNRTSDAFIELRTPFSKLTAKEKADGVVEPLIDHRSNAAALQSAILSITLPEDLSSAIAGFTCFGIIDRQPISEQQEGGWISKWKVNLHSCPTAFA